MNGKQAAGYKAVEWIEEGMTVGLGTGSTAYWAIQKIGERVSQGLNIKAVATSKASEDLARELHIPLTDAASVRRLDVTIDGADEIDPQLSLIKGGGGALLREKLVALQSDRFIVVADDSKVVPHLGKFKLPIEIVAFSYEWTLDALQSKYDVSFELRKQDGKLYVTDNGNYIVDAAFVQIDSPANLAAELKRLTGVVEHGLFIGMADVAIIGYADGHIEMLDKK